LPHAQRCGAGPPPNGLRKASLLGTGTKQTRHQNEETERERGEGDRETERGREGGRENEKWREERQRGTKRCFT